MWRRARPREPHAHESCGPNESYQPFESNHPDEPNAHHAYESNERSGPDESYDSGQ